LAFRTATDGYISVPDTPRAGWRFSSGESVDGPRNPHDILDVLGEKELSTGCRALTSTTR
jgi:hypothetical protein